MQTNKIPKSNKTNQCDAMPSVSTKQNAATF